jgi:hypothetical protein
MFKKLLCLISLVFIASACSLYRVDTEEISYNYYPPTSPEIIQIMDNVTQPHEVIGYITVNAERNQKMDEILYKMKKEAAKLGGNVITNVHSDATGLWKKVPPQKLLGNAYIRANFTAQVVVLK